MAQHWEFAEMFDIWATTALASPSIIYCVAVPGCCNISLSMQVLAVGLMAPQEVRACNAVEVRCNSSLASGLATCFSFLQADVRVPDGQPMRWSVSADVEALAWSPHAPTTFLVSSEDGLVSSYDARAGAGSNPLFRLSAHDAATCALSFNPAVPGLLATASTDAQVCCTARREGACPTTAACMLAKRACPQARSHAMSTNNSRSQPDVF